MLTFARWISVVHVYICNLVLTLSTHLNGKLIIYKILTLHIVKGAGHSQIKETKNVYKSLTFPVGQNFTFVHSLHGKTIVCFKLNLVFSLKRGIYYNSTCCYLNLVIVRTGILRTHDILEVICFVLCPAPRRTTSTELCCTFYIHENS